MVKILLVLGYIANSALKPREGDCLLDEFNLFVHAKAIEKRNVLLSNPTDKVCNSMPF